MSSETPNTETLSTTAETVCAGAQELVDMLARNLRVKVERDGKISAAAMDGQQLICYELAQNQAEVTAARHMLEYAREARQAWDGGAVEMLLEERLALLYAAEMAHGLKGRMFGRMSDYGLTPPDIESRLGTPEALGFLAAQQSQSNLEAVGQAVRDAHGSTGVRLLDEDHRMMRETFGKFSDEEVAPRAEEIHRHDKLIPPEIIDPLREMGCFGLSIPERFGGFQSDDHEDNMGMIVVTEELSRGSLGAAGSLITRPEILSRALLDGGTEEQKEKWLPLLAQGDPLCAVTVTEPDFGSDVAGIRCTATRTEGGWLINGTKSWGTFAGKAGVLLVLARTDPDASKGHKGLSILLAEKPSYDGHDFEFEQEGGGKLSGRAIPTIGYRGMHSYDLFFEEFFVPEENLLGGEAGLGKGFYYQMSGFAGGRIQTAARAIGVMQAAFDAGYKYAEERKVFGNPVAHYGLSKTKLARLASLVAVSREFTYAVGRLMDQGKGRMEASLVKFFTCKLAEWITREAMQLHGGMGYAEEVAVSRYFVDARVLSIFEGAEEILAIKVIARALLDRAN